MPLEDGKHIYKGDGGGSRIGILKEIVSLELSCAVYIQENNSQAKRGTTCIPDRGGKVIRSGEGGETGYVRNAMARNVCMPFPPQDHLTLPQVSVSIMDLIFPRIVTQQSAFVLRYLCMVCNNPCSSVIDVNV